MDLSGSLAANQIAPFFGSVPLDKITDKDVDKWLLGFQGRGKKDEKTGEIKGHYKNSYANAAFRTRQVYQAPYPYRSGG